MEFIGMMAKLFSVQILLKTNNKNTGTTFKFSLTDISTL